jgi:hypothetical protein
MLEDVAAVMQYQTVMNMPVNAAGTPVSSTYLSLARARSLSLSLFPNNSEKSKTTCLLPFN